MLQKPGTVRSTTMIGVIRILFGVVWLIDAQFKWRSDFINNFASYLTDALDGQPAMVKVWIQFWLDIVTINPVFFAYIVALAETALAVALILGLLSNLANVGGAILSFVIWSTAEGFGGPYGPGATDIGCAVMYIFIFALLWQTRAGLYLGIDRKLGERLGNLAYLASGRVV